MRSLAVLQQLRVDVIAGITLTFIEESGLLETAENLGLLSAAADRCVAMPDGSIQQCAGLSMWCFGRLTRC